MKKHIKLLAITLSLLLLAGCMRNKLDKPFIGEEGKTVNVSLQVKIAKTYSIKPDAVSAPTSKGSSSDKALEIYFDEEPKEVITRSDGTTKFYNLWLFQFDASGNINGLPHKISDEITAINDMIMFDVPLVVSTNQTLYIASLGREIDVDMMGVNSIKSLEKLEFGYISSKGGVVRSNITTDEDVPFAGFVSGVTVLEMPTGENRGQVEYNLPDGFVGGISIKRLMTRITLRYKFEVPDHIMEGLKLINVSPVIRFANPTINTSNDKYVNIENLASTTPDADGFYTATWYVAQNQQGEVASILAENDRYNDGTTGSAPAKGVHIEAWAYRKNDINNYAVYQMYVGRNNTSNFDVTANVHYNLRTIINTDVASATNDRRVKAYLAKQTTSFYASDLVSERSSDSQYGEMYDIDAHYDKRTIVINAKGRIVKVGIYTDSECTNLASPANSWLKLSSSNNYTDAYNSSEPLNTEVITDIILLPTELNIYLYADEYVFGNDGKIPGKDEKRRLYLKVTSTTEGVGGVVTQNSLRYCVDQRPPIYVGAFAGELVDGQYTEAICFERIREYRYSYITGGESIRQNGLPIGYFSHNLVLDINYSGVTDPNNGMLATKQRVYNESNYIVNLGRGSTTINMENPRMRPDKEPELYQYSHYNTYIARACFDRNRDNNGNGKIDKNEFVWYQPAIYQLLAIWVVAPLEYPSGTAISVNDTKEIEKFYSVTYNNGSLGYSNDKGSGGNFVCIRNVPVE